MGQKKFIGRWGMLFDNINKTTKSSFLLSARKIFALSVLPLLFAIIFLCNFSEAANGRVVTVDGINPVATATGSIFGDSSTGYIYTAIMESLKREDLIETIGQIQPFYWSNDAIYTDAAVQSLTTILRSAYTQTSANNAPLVIVSHSWGTVLTYIVLEKNPDIVVDKLITMGSPLSVSPLALGLRGIIGTFTSEKLLLQGIIHINTLSNIKAWANYWTDCDVVSASISAIGGNNYDVNAPGSDIGTCHGFYYNDISTWDGILTDAIPLQITYDPHVPTAPATITFNATGFLTNNGAATYSWDFGDGQGSGKSVTHTYKQPGNYNVTLTMADGAGPHVLTESVTLLQPEITVTAPNGFTNLYRHFETPAISGIKAYSWDFGDGTVRTDDNNTTSHTYATSGYYNVTLTQTLSDNTPIPSYKGIFVGPGTRYIQGHTIYDSETWDSGGTYVVEGSIDVAQGATLTINTGTTVLFFGLNRPKIYH